MEKAELKSKAKAQLKGNYLILFLCDLIYQVVNSYSNYLVALLTKLGTSVAVDISASSFAGNIIVSAILAPISISLTLMYLGMIKGENPNISDMFAGFSFWIKTIIFMFLHSFLLVLWYMLFIVPGIIKGYSYAMAPYIFAENPDKEAMECITESRKMMKGYKLDLFALQLSFLGWIIVGILTLGIGFIWITPYMRATTANFYNELKEKPEVNEIITVAIED